MTSSGAQGAEALAELSRLARIDEYEVLPAGFVPAQRPAPLPAPDPDDKLRLDLSGLTELARRITGASLAMVNIIGAESQFSISAQGFEGMVCSRDDALCNTVFAGGETVVVPDARADPRFALNPFVTGRLDRVRFYAASPLVTPGGLSIGTLCIADHEVLDLAPEQVEALRTLAEQTVDVFELHRRTHQLDAAVAALVRSNTALAEFAARVSHDLQAPLNSIMGFAEILAGNVPGVSGLPVTLAAGGSVPGSEVYLERIQAAAGRMHTMIRDLLAYARSGAALQPRPVDLAPLLDDLLRDLDGPRRASGARVRVEVTPGRPLPGDESQLRALLQNLLTNAMKYRAPGRPCEITVRAGPDGDGWFVQVDDNGRGVPPDERARVLQPLARLDRDRDVPGTGVGLATAARIAEAHHAALELADSPAGGLRVTVRFA